MKHHSENILPIGGASEISPSWNQFRAPLLAGISTVLMAVGITFLMRHFRIGLTPSNSSCAEGFYRLVDAPLGRGELAAACLPVNAEQEGLMRGYLGNGDCPGGAEPVLKVIGGLRGDEVDVEAGWIAVNGKRLANRDSDAGQCWSAAHARRVGQAPSRHGRGLAIWFEQPAKLGFPILRSDSFAGDSRSCRASGDVVTSYGEWRTQHRARS